MHLLATIPGTIAEAADVWAVGVMLWESLAGRHPFWQTSMLDTARAIESGAPSLATLRPDLPKPLSSSSTGRCRRRRRGGRPRQGSPTRFAEPPPIAAASGRGRSASRCRRRRVRRRRGPRSRVRRLDRGRLSLYPHGWAVGLAVLAAAVTAFRPRAGLAVALAVPVLPLGNISFGLALLYGALALAWLVLCWREPRGGLLFALGPLLVPLSALGLVPLAAATLRAGPRRACQAGLAVLAAALVAGMRHAALPLVGSAPPLGLGIAVRAIRSTSQGRSPAPRPPIRALLVEAVVFAVVALALPFAHAAAAGARPARRRHAHRHRRRGAVGTGASLAVAAWLTAAAVALRAGARNPGPRGTLTRAMVLRSIEQKIEALFEGVFGRAFRTNVQPVELARKLAKEMDDHRVVSVSRVYVPNEYTVYLSTGDREQFEGYEDSLCPSSRSTSASTRSARTTRC